MMPTTSSGNQTLAETTALLPSRGGDATIKSATKAMPPA
jgi:hypothetical protein